MLHFSEKNMSSKKKSTSSRSAKSKAKVYVSDDEDEAFVHTFDVQEKLKSKSFPKFFIKEMKGEEVKEPFVQNHHFHDNFAGDT